MFKRKRGIPLPYNIQGWIYFTCMNIRYQPKEVQERIRSLCKEVAKEDSDGLFEYLTNDRRTAESIYRQYYITVKKLYQYRKDFYIKWARDGF